MLNRAAYLKDPEKWFRTKEEQDLILFCIKDIQTREVPEYKIDWIEDNIYLDNHKLRRMEASYIILSKRVLEVYNDRCHRNNTKSK